MGNIGAMPDRLRKIQYAGLALCLLLRRCRLVSLLPKRKQETRILQLGLDEYCRFLHRNDILRDRPLRYHRRVLPRLQSWRCPSESSRKPSAWSTSREHLCYANICGFTKTDVCIGCKASARHPTMTTSGTSTSPSTGPANLRTRVCMHKCQRRNPG